MRILQKGARNLSTFRGLRTMAANFRQESGSIMTQKRKKNCVICFFYVFSSTWISFRVAG